MVGQPCRKCLKPPLPEKSLCAYHLEYERKRSAKRRQKQLDKGKCAYFGCSSEPRENHGHCLEHCIMFRKHQNQLRKRRALMNRETRMKSS